MKRTTFALVTLVALVGCGAPKYETPQNEGTNGPFTEETVTLRDGSTVTCLTYDRALDCDWTNR